MTVEDFVFLISSLHSYNTFYTFWPCDINVHSQIYYLFVFCYHEDGKSWWFINTEKEGNGMFIKTVVST